MKYLVYHFCSKNIAFCNSKYMYLMFRYVYCFHLYLLTTQIGTLPTPFFKVYFFSRSTFFMDLVYLFDSKNVSFGNSICRYLMFLHVSFSMSVYLFHGLVPCLSLFRGQDISFCYTTSENWSSFSRLEYFGFLFHRQERKERKVFLTSFLDACMSANFTD